MTLHPAIVFLGGLVVIILGAELLLRGATRIAAMLRVKPILIGLTVVAIGTSMPELAVGITAVTEGKGPLAVGNIAGANILNILFILGLSALIRPLPMHVLSIKLDVPVMIATAFALMWMAWDGVLNRTEGLLLLGGAVAYVVLLVRMSRRESAQTRHEFVEEYSPKVLLAASAARRAGWNAFLLIAGIALTLLGADLLVAGAVSIAQALGVSDAVIGLTIVALGTTAPEFTTAMVATLKDDRDVAIGNLIGSNITNVLVVLGLTSIVAPGGIDVGEEILRIDLPLAAAVALACLPVFSSNRTVSRLEGGLFVTAYLLYLGSLLFIRA